MNMHLPPRRFLAKFKNDEQEDFTLPPVSILALLLLVLPFSSITPAWQPVLSKDSIVVCVLSDTQEPLLTEQLMLGYHGNAAARRCILKEILRMQPDAVFHLGDFTGLGVDEEAWKEAQSFQRDLTASHIPYSTVPGNHEYMFYSEKSLTNYEEATGAKRPYHSVTKAGNIAVILFNSNFSALADEERHEQFAWYYNAMQLLEADSTVRYIVAGTHHAPYTNSRIVSAAMLGRDSAVMADYLSEFTGSKKTIIFLSGHAHAYELFRFNGKLFMVTGGGGGALQPLLRGNQQRFADLFGNTDERRAFHFISIEQHGKQVTIYLHILAEQQDKFTVLKIADFQ